MKYALMVKLGVDDWIYVTESNTDKCWDLRPVLYDSFESANQAASIWRTQGTANCKVVEFLQEVK